MPDEDMDVEEETTPTLTKEQIREWQKALLEVRFEISGLDSAGFLIELLS